MVQRDAALAVMGHHEFNALGYHTKDPQQPNAFLRPHTEQNYKQHRAFLDAFEKEVRLPEGKRFLDKDGHERHEVRIKWWKKSGTFRSLAIGPKTNIPEDPIGVEHLITYGRDEPPVFVGHYWLEGTPALLASNVACLDYSVAMPDGKLVAYRWDGEQVLDVRNLVKQYRLEAAPS